MIEKKIIINSFKNHSGLVEQTLERQTDNIAKAASLIINNYNDGGKVVLFGNGGSAADAQHLAGELVGRFLLKRKSLPAIALTTDTSVLTALGNDYGFDKVFQRQVESLVNKGDVVIAISTSGNSENVVNGVVAAKRKGAKIIVLSGESGGKLRDRADILINVPSKDVPRIQEVHILVGHVLCNLVESTIFQRNSQ
jgi:D-sedoheptulose 7-phosphate isomerase